MNTRYTKDVLEAAIAQSMSWSNVCRILGVKPATGAQTYIKNRAILFEINYSHFTGQAHNKGRSWISVKIEKYLCEGSIINSHRLKLYLFREGLKEKKCESCGISEWMGHECVFELDHVNQVRHDNRIENLRILCPNCHALKTRNQLKNAPVA